MTLPAAAPAPDALVQTRLFGEVRVPASAMVTFSDGIPGFEEARAFALLPAAPRGSYWLQSLSDASLAFFVVEARAIEPAVFGETPDLLAIVTLPADREASATANLRAPLLIDWATQTGLQLIGVDESWSTAHPFDLAALLQ